jgi:RNA polymerase sigma factor (sigma-70 family)
MEREGESVARLVGGLRASDDEAAAKLWQDYFQRLVASARSMLRGTFRRTADEEDIALSAFASFCRGVEAGRFPRLEDRDDLWRALFALVARKSARHHRDRARLKRDDRRTVDEAGLDLNALAASEPTPEFVAEVAEECERLLRLLDDDDLRRLAVMKMEGYTNDEIAERLTVAPRTVERRLRLIRATWMAEPER